MNAENVTKRDTGLRIVQRRLGKLGTNEETGNLIITHQEEIPTQLREMKKIFQMTPKRKIQKTNQAGCRSISKESTLHPPNNVSNINFQYKLNQR